MKEFIGIKKIEAEPMTRGDYNKYRGWDIPKDENPEDEGYLVKYPDGYESWSPKNVFEEAYHEVGKDLLVDSALAMVSKDYKERFRAEYIQVALRFNRLMDMLNKWDKGELDFKPTCPRSTYALQLEFMLKYAQMLEARAKIEEIKLL